MSNAVSPDINTIPNDLIERVDIVTGGNSGIGEAMALFAAQVTVVCVNDAGRPARIPAEVAARVQGADLAPN